MKTTNKQTKTLLVAAVMTAMTGSVFAADTTVGTGNGIAYGTATAATGVNSVAIGNTATATGNYTVAIGSKAAAGDYDSIAIGKNASASKAGTVVIGRNATSNEELSLAVGTDTNSAWGGTAVGVLAKATGTQSTALGNGANATNLYATAVGVGAKATGVSATVVGISKATGNHSIAVGYAAESSGKQSIAVGTTAVASGVKAIAVGSNNKAEGEASINIGSDNYGASANTTIVGSNNSIDHTDHMIDPEGDVVIGTGNHMQDAYYGIVVGKNSSLNNADNSVVVGNDAAVTVAESVAIGHNSKANSVVSTASASIANKTYNFAGGTALGTVSVGDTGKERTVTNVAAGRISDTSTDAINGSQLNAAIEAINKNHNDIADTAKGLSMLGDIVADHDTAIADVTAEANKHTTVVAGNNVEVTSQSNANGGTEYTINVSRTAIDAIAKASNRFAGDDVIKVERWSAPSNVADLTTFKYDGSSAATKTPLTYKANGTTETTMLSDGLNFTNGNNTTASVGSDGVVKYDLNKDITVDSVTTDKANISDVIIDSNGINAGGKTITNVGTGTSANDVATVGQVNDLRNVLVNGNTDTLNRANSYTDSQVAKVGAQSAALAGLHPLDFNKDDKASYAASFGHYRNANALAVGAFYRPNERTMVSTAVSFGQHPQVNVGVAFKVGKGSEYINEAKSKDSRIAKLEALVDKLTAEVAELKASK